MIRQPPRWTVPDTLCPYATHFRSEVARLGGVVVARDGGGGAGEEAFDRAGDAAVGLERAGARAVVMDVLASREIRHEAAHRAHVIGLFRGLLMAVADLRFAVEGEAVLAAGGEQPHRLPGQQGGRGLGRASWWGKGG